MTTQGLSPFPSTPPKLFTLLPGVTKPDFTKSAKSIYPFDEQTFDVPFCAGKNDKKLKQRVYAAIYNRKKKHPTEDYRLHVCPEGYLYVWKVAA